jgi:hypothetical protein
LFRPIKPLLRLLQPGPISSSQQRGEASSQRFDAGDDRNADLVRLLAAVFQYPWVSLKQVRERIRVEDDHDSSSVIGRPRCL